MAEESQKSLDDPEMNALWDEMVRRRKESPQAGIEPLPPSPDVQWKDIFFESVQKRALHLQTTKIGRLHKNKAQQEKVEKKTPPDGLPRELLDKEGMTLETRAYLLDKLLPTLVPGVEKLLKVAERKKVIEADTEEPSKFNPINFLGEYLMRCNPAYQTAGVPDPYVRGIKAVTEELKAQVPETTQHKLVQMKVLVEDKRKQREQVAEIKRRVKDMRTEALAMQFREWTRDITSQIPLVLVQSALKSFLDISPLPVDASEGIYARPVEAIETLELKVNEEEFAEYVFSYINNFTSDMFQELLKHLLQCANDAREIIKHDKWRQCFLQLFLDCDHGQVGLLHRQRVLALLENFYNNCSLPVRKGLRNPSQWPMIELDDIDLFEFWGQVEDGQGLSKLSSLLNKSSQLELSAQASLLNQILKGILSEEVLALPDTRMSLDSEEVVLVQQAISASEIIASEEVVEGQEEMVALPDTETITGVSLSSKEVVLEQRVSSASKTIASKEVVEGQEQQVSSASKTIASKEVVEGQEEPDPTTFAGSSAAVEDPFIEAMKVGLDTRESNENMRPEGSATTSEGEATVLPEEVSKGSDLGSVEQMSSDEPGTTVKTSIAEPASSLGEETTVPKKDMGAEEGHEHSDEIPKDQPDVITAESLVQATVEGQVSGLSWLPSWKSSKSFSKTPQLISEPPWSGNIETANLAFRYSDYGKEVWEDWKTENSRFPGLLMNMLDIQSHGAPSSTSAFDKHFLNLPQFVQLMEMFIGTEISLLDLKKLVQFVKEGYVLLEREKISQMERVHHDAFVARQQLLLAALFEKWDNEGSGFLDMKEVDAVLSTFKEGMEQEALEKAKLQLPIPLQHPSGVVKLSQKDFRTYIDLVAAEFTGNEDEVLDNIVEYLMTTVEKTHAEQLRGAARRKWLYAVQHTAKINGGSIDPVYQAAFKALARDADAHGEGKTISAHIALLEYNILFPERGDVLLRYVACTEDDAPYLLNQSLYMDMKGISFAAALEDRPIHVPRVQLHGHIHFWNYNRPEKERKGSFLVIPLEDIRRRVFGILGLDTLRDQNEDSIIVPHEIRFYQGVAKAFSVAYHHIRTQDSIKQVIVTGVEWLSTKAPGIHAISAYFMEPGKERIQDYTLRRVMTTNRKGQMEIIPHPAPVLSRNENIFRDYLFKCIDCAEVVAAYVYEDHHIAVPLRDPAGYATVVLDINLRRREKLPAYEHKDLQKMLKMVQEAICEILKEELGDLEPYHVLEAEYVGDWRRGGVLFYRFMLQDLQNCIFNLDPQTCFKEIKSYEKPPLLVHKILKCVLLILYPQWAGTEEVENWKCCLKKLDEELIENISYFDPTAAYVQVRSEILYRCLQGIQRTAVWKAGSAPLEYLYNWTLTCLSLIELAKKLQYSQTAIKPSYGRLLPSPIMSRTTSMFLENINPTFTSI